MVSTAFQGTEVPEVQKVDEGARNASRGEHGGRKVSRNRLSRLMRFILQNASSGIERGEIVQRFYGLERRYRGFYTDPCLRGRRKRDYERRYRAVQPTVTRALRRLAERGLVELLSPGSHVKMIRLTELGKRTQIGLMQMASHERR